MYDTSIHSRQLFIFLKKHSPFFLKFLKFFNLIFFMQRKYSTSVAVDPRPLWLLAGTLRFLPRLQDSGLDGDE